MATILVIDDDQAIVDALQTALSIKGYEVVSTTNADEAVPLATECDPDLILLDYLLSGSNGSEIVEDLRLSPQTRSIPIVMLSAHPKAQDEAKTNGARAFLPKPFELQVLYDIVHTYISEPRDK